jgi:hypothetical protein
MPWGNPVEKSAGGLKIIGADGDWWVSGVRKVKAHGWFCACGWAFRVAVHKFASGHLRRAPVLVDAGLESVGCCFIDIKSEMSMNLGGWLTAGEKDKSVENLKNPDVHRASISIIFLNIFLIVSKG